MIFYVKVLLGRIHLEVSAEDRSCGIYLFYKNRTLINYEKHFPRYFKCVVCNKKVEYDGEKLKLCAVHYDDCMEYFKEKLPK